MSENFAGSGCRPISLTSRCTLLALALLVTSCSDAPRTTVAIELEASVPRQDAATQDYIPGYVHVLARSRFHVGNAVHEVEEFGMRKVIGDNGVFATNLNTQAVTALPNLNILDTPTALFRGDDTAQNAAVIAYLVGAGLPSAQVLSVRADETGLSRMETGVSDPVVHAWFSVLVRGFEGVRVEDSTAWAAMGADGSSLEESVYWPEIGVDVVTELRAFRNMLQTPGEEQAFLARLPPSATDGELVVHHTSALWTGAFEARACYRTNVSGTALHFDRNGLLVQLADEASAR